MLNDPGLELVEVVDSEGAVTDVVTRSRMRSERLRHRCTYIAVIVAPVGSLVPSLAFDDQVSAFSELIVHQRADWKDTYPSYWDLAFGGVCSVGESWETSARRELEEEAGIVGAELIDLGPTRFEDAENKVVGQAFLTAWPHEPVCGDGEVVALDRVPLGQLEAWLEGRSVCPDTAAVMVPRLLAALPS